ncbi:MAG: DUF92 domain-containing protein [Candidatus Micrarchaeota archaeon]
MRLGKGELGMLDFSIFSGIIAILVLASVAARHELLSEGGVLAALIIGAAIFWFGGWPWFLLLTSFFALASIATKFGEKDKEIPNKEFAKGGVRDFMQVGANGALAAFIAVAYHFFPDTALYFAYLGVISTVTADTIATELGLFSRQAYLITTFKKVRRGLSGAVSLRGTAMAMVFAFLIGASALAVNSYFQFTTVSPGALLAIATIAGTGGALADSILGATIQMIFYCRRCRKETEREVHKCGTKTSYKRGLHWVTNDTVNLLSSAVGGIIAAGLYMMALQ